MYRDGINQRQENVGEEEAREALTGDTVRFIEKVTIILFAF